MSIYDTSPGAVARQIEAQLLKRTIDTGEARPFQNMDAGEIAADLLKINGLLDSLPPVPRAFLASPLVPYGDFKRQWDTKGRLFIWVDSYLMRQCIRACKAEERPQGIIGSFGTDVIFVDQDRDLSLRSNLGLTSA